MKRILAFMLIFLCLSACSRKSPVQTAAEDGKITYSVQMLDAQKHAAAGVMVQFCDSSVCQLVTTGDDGGCTFRTEDKSCTVHIFKVPEGYALPQTEYSLDAAESALVLILSEDAP